MGKTAGIIYRSITTNISKKAGHIKTTVHTDAVTLIQRFSVTINLNVHFHMLLLNGVWLDGRCGLNVRFHWIKQPSSAELAGLTHGIAIGAWLVYPLCLLAKTR